MDRNSNQEHISIRADASELLEDSNHPSHSRCSYVSIRADASELLEAKFVQA